MTTLLTALSDTASFSPPMEFRGAAAMSRGGGGRPTAGASPRAPSLACGTPPERADRPADASAKDEVATRITPAGLNRIFNAVDVDQNNAYTKIEQK